VPIFPILDHQKSVMHIVQCTPLISSITIYEGMHTGKKKTYSLTLVYFIPTFMWIFTYLQYTHNYYTNFKYILLTEIPSKIKPWNKPKSAWSRILCRWGRERNSHDRGGGVYCCGCFALRIRQLDAAECLSALLIEKCRMGTGGEVVSVLLGGSTVNITTAGTNFLALSHLNSPIYCIWPTVLYTYTQTSPAIGIKLNVHANEGAQTAGEGGAQVNSLVVFPWVISVPYCSDSRGRGSQGRFPSSLPLGNYCTLLLRQQGKGEPRSIP